MGSYVFDTNVITGLLNADEAINIRYAQCVQEQHLILGCPIVYYEVKKGLIARDNKKKTDLFEATYQTFQWREYTRADWLLAATLWAKRRALGRPVEDADLFIAVFAINNHATLVTHNMRDFDHLDVMLEDWIS